MKRVALFVFALVVAAIAEENLDDMAEKFDTDVPTLQVCLDEAEIKIEEVHNFVEMWKSMGNDNMNEELKQNFVKYNLFLACILEKNGMLVDKKLVVDKLLASMEKDEDVKNFSDKESLKKCMNSLNESDMTREERVFGLELCIANSMGEEKK